MDSTRILIVEDEIIVAEDLAGQLRQLGHEVVGIASEGEEAVSMARRLEPDLILMDIRLMGSMDGIAAAETIRRERDVPVIYLTALSDPATLARAKNTEPFGYMLKPFNERELAIQIELAIYKHRAEREIRERGEWLRVTLRSIGDAVMAADADERITFVNPVAESLSGWTADEAVGRSVPEVFRIVSEETGRPVEEPVARALREGRVVPLPNGSALVTKDGRIVPVEDSAAPILDDKGRVIGAVLVFHDITEKHRAQEAIRDREALLRLALQGAGGGAWNIDMVRDRSWWSPEMCALWGLPPDTPMSLENLLDRIHEADRERFLHAVEASRASGEDFECEFRLRDTGNGERRIGSRGRAVRDASGRAARLLGIARDIGEAGSGTAFRVCPPPMESFEEAEEIEPAGEEDGGRERILLVDDEAPIVRLEKKMLERLGYRVAAFGDAPEALAAFRANPEGFDLALTDMAMPRLSGDRFARELRNIRPDIPVLVLAGHSAKIDSETAAEPGIRGYLRKPVPRAELARAVRAALDDAAHRP